MCVLLNHQKLHQYSALYTLNFILKGPLYLMCLCLVLINYLNKLAFINLTARSTFNCLFIIEIKFLRALKQKSKKQKSKKQKSKKQKSKKQKSKKQKSKKNIYFLIFFLIYAP